VCPNPEAPSADAGDDGLFQGRGHELKPEVTPRERLAVPLCLVALDEDLAKNCPAHDSRNKMAVTIPNE
jgi:hypothetical protein